jgi:hypothetical protein
MNGISLEFMQSSYIVILVVYGIMVAFNVYMMYLNWKQSKVLRTQQDILQELKYHSELFVMMIKKRDKK